MLRVHFLNVGHGECTIIQHPSGRLSMIDINVSEQYDPDTEKELVAEQYPFALPGFYSVYEIAKKEITDPVNFLQQHYPGQGLWRFILTHPDLDHMRGLKRLHDEVGFSCFWDCDNTKETPNFRKGTNDDVDWQFYKSLRGWGQRRCYFRGHQLYAFGSDQDGTGIGDNIEILSPTPALVKQCNDAAQSNDLSYVLRVRHAGKSLLLTGDVESKGWDDLVAHYGRGLKADYLSASHHGRDTGYHFDALNLIQPAVCIVSVGRKPPTDASRKYANMCASVFSTRYYGNIELQVYDDGTSKWFVQRNGG